MHPKRHRGEFLSEREHTKTGNYQHRAVLRSHSIQQGRKKKTNQNNKINPHTAGENIKILILLQTKPIIPVYWSESSFFYYETHNLELRFNTQNFSHVQQDMIKVSSRKAGGKKVPSRSPEAFLLVLLHRKGQAGIPVPLFMGRICKGSATFQRWCFPRYATPSVLFLSPKLLFLF